MVRYIPESDITAALFRLLYQRRAAVNVSDPNSDGV